MVKSPFGFILSSLLDIILPLFSSMSITKRLQFGYNSVTKIAVSFLSCLRESFINAADLNANFEIDLNANFKIPKTTRTRFARTRRFRNRAKCKILPFLKFLQDDVLCGVEDCLAGCLKVCFIFYRVRRGVCAVLGPVFCFLIFVPLLFLKPS